MTIDLYFVLFFLSWAFLRIGFVHFITLISHSGWSEKTRVYNIGIPTEQVEREKFWPLPFFVDALGFAWLAYWGILVFVEWRSLPTLTQTMTSCLALGLAHALIAEPLYYWYHLLLHRNKTLRKHHVKHHKAIVPTPPSGYTFTVFERTSYLVLFAIPIVIVGWLNQLTPVGFFAYYIVFDFLNSIGHCNVEFFPKWYIHSPLKWVIYSPSFHNLHHSRWETNYTLFMPIYDWIFGTRTSESDSLFIRARSGQGPSDLRRFTTDDTGSSNLDKIIPISTIPQPQSKEAVT